MRRLSRLLRRRARGLAPLELTSEMLASARAAEAASPGAGMEALSREVEQVAAYVSHLRREIGVLKPSEILLERIPTARDDLNQVTEVTRAAADRIMGAAETIIAADHSAEAFPATLEERLTEIIEACSFQDIVGQRLTRTVSAVDFIEKRLERFVETVKVPDATDVYDRDAILQEAHRKVLLVDGPQDTSHAVEQGAIDRLFE